MACVHIAFATFFPFWWIWKIRMYKTGLSCCYLTVNKQKGRNLSEKMWKDYTIGMNVCTMIIGLSSTCILSHCILFWYLKTRQFKGKGAEKIISMQRRDFFSLERIVCNSGCGKFLIAIEFAKFGSFNKTKKGGAWRLLMSKQCERSSFVLRKRRNRKLLQDLNFGGEKREGWRKAKERKTNNADAKLRNRCKLFCGNKKPGNNSCRLRSSCYLFRTPRPNI